MSWRPAARGSSARRRPVHRLVPLRQSARVLSRRTDDTGQVGGVEVLPLGLLVLTVGSLLIANGWAVIDAKAAAGAAAREAARSYAETPAGLADDAAWARAQARGMEAFVSAGKDPIAAEVVPVEGGRTVTRCGRVVVEARYRVPAITVPFVGGLGDGIEVRARHSALVDPYRSGLQRGGGCG